MLTSDKHNAGGVIAIDNDKLTIGSESEKRQYEFSKTNTERFSGNEVVLKVSHAELGNYELKKEVELGKSWEMGK